MYNKGSDFFYKFLKYYKLDVEEYIYSFSNLGVEVLRKLDFRVFEVYLSNIIRLF